MLIKICLGAKYTHVWHILASDTTRLWDNPFSGQIRLNGSTYVTDGVVEVYCNGEWGTICDDGFNNYTAATVCYQLGYNDYVTYDNIHQTYKCTMDEW